MDLGIAGLGDAAEVATTGSVATYSATLANDRDVVVQVIDCAEPTFLERFGRERELLLSLSRSPKIVTIHDAGTTTTGSPYLVMDPSIVSLEDVVAADGPLPEAKASRILAGVAEGVADAHLIGMVHRGIGPSAIRRSQDGEFRLADFCLGALDACEQHRDYLAPEARRSGAGPIGAAVDVYSLGATLLHTVTGKSPGDPGGLDSVRPGPVRDLIAAAMDFDPARRPSSLELQRRLVALGEPDSRELPPPPERRVVPVAVPPPEPRPRDRIDLPRAPSPAPAADVVPPQDDGFGGAAGIDPDWAPPVVEPAVVGPPDDTSETIDLVDVLASSPDAAEEWRSLVADQDEADTPPAQPPTTESTVLAPTESPSPTGAGRGAVLEAPLPESAGDSAARATMARYDPLDRRRSRAELLDDIVWRIRSFTGVLVGMVVGALLLAGAYYYLEQRSADPDAATVATSTIAPTGTTAVAVIPVVSELDREAATTRLGNAGFEVQTAWEFHPSLTRGQVITSEPLSGAAAPVGSTVTLTLSRGTEPRCAGASEAAARRQLEGRGLKVAGVTRSSNDAIDEDLVVRCLIYDDTETAVIIVSDGASDIEG